MWSWHSLKCSPSSWSCRRCAWACGSLKKSGSHPDFSLRCSLLEIFGYFLLVVIGVKLLETLMAHIKKDVIHVSVVLEVVLIAMVASQIDS